MEYMNKFGWCKYICIDPNNPMEMLMKWVWEDGHSALDKRFIPVEKFVSVLSDNTWNWFREETRNALLDAVAHNIDYIVFIVS